MNHLKKFENRQLQGNPVVFNRVQFGLDDEEVYALYADGELVKYGDFYHDKIEVWIDAFIQGVKWGGTNVLVYKDVCNNEELVKNICELGSLPPKNLSDIYSKTNELFGINRSIRMIKHLEERDADEVKILIKQDQIFDLTFDLNKFKNKTVSTYKFNISCWEPLREYDNVKVELTNWLKSNILTPGMTDYKIYINNKELSCSNKIVKEIFNILKRIKL